MLNELLESQKSFQGLIKAIPHDQGIFSDALRNLTQQLSSFTRNFERSFSFGYHSDDLNARKSSMSNDASPNLDDSPTGKKLSIPLFKNPQLKSPFNARQSHDLKVTEWLLRHGFDDDARSSVAIADFTYEDFIYESDKDDIRRIGLRWKVWKFSISTHFKSIFPFRAGTEVRMWRHIQFHRKKYKYYPNELAQTAGNSVTNGFACSMHDVNSYDSTSSATNSNSSNYDSCGGDDKE